jgi:hypothetical protein
MASLSRRTQWLWVIGIVLFGALLVVLRVNGAEPPGEAVPIMGRIHIPASDSPHEPYNSNPPTSGPHVGGEAPLPGVYANPIPYELLVHSLEHGHIVLYYGPGVTAAERAAARRLYDRFSDRVLVVPSPEGAPGLVLTSWGRILRMEKLHYSEMERFVRAWGGRDWHAPE